MKPDHWEVQHVFAPGGAETLCGLPLAVVGQATFTPWSPDCVVCADLAPGAGVIRIVINASEPSQ